MYKSTALLAELIFKYESRLGVAADARVAPLVSPPFVEEVKLASETKSQPETKVEEVVEEHKTPAVIKLADAHAPVEAVDFSKAPYELFSEIDVRIGNIVDCWKHPSSENLYCEKIDLGEGQPREIGSGLQKHVNIDDMRGTVCVVANLKPRKLAGFNSNGMIFALHTQAGEIKIVRPGDAEVGSRVGLDGVVEASKSKFLPVLNPKKKVFEKAAAYFTTDAQGFACFGEKKLTTTAGFIQTGFPNARIS